MKLFLRAGNSPDHGAIGIAIHLVITVMAGVTLLGALLIWKGAKGKKSYGSWADKLPGK